MIFGLFVMHCVLLRMSSNQPMKSGTNEYDLIEEFVAVMWKEHCARKLKEKVACEVSDDDGCTRPEVTQGESRLGKYQMRT